MKKRTKGLITSIVFLAVAVLIGLFVLLPSLKKEPENVDVPQQEPQPVINRMDEELRKLWLENKSINEDYVGEIIFDSGLINQSFVQATSCYKDNGEPYRFYSENGRIVNDFTGLCGNDVYIWTYWKTMEYDYNDHGGSVFMDYRNYLSDQNIIIYGHHFSEAGGHDPSRSKAFTPLEKLLDKENYEDNKYVSVVLDNEIRRYELAIVYEYDIYNEDCANNCQYYRTDYNQTFDGNDDPGYGDIYMKAAKGRAYYDTGVKITGDDRTLTLQTCISGYAGELFQIMVFKQIDTVYYED